MTAPAVVFIGAAGEMCRIAVRRFAVAVPDADLTLCDIRPELLDPLLAALPPGRATARRLDLFDRDDLREVVAGADLVVLGAGPYLRTSAPVIEACLEAGVPYLDFDDDVESTQHALGLGRRAEEAGIGLHIGCGASPGMTNVMVMDAASSLDHVETVDMCWVVGDERPGIGRAVLEHLLHIAAGPCLTWEDGGPVMHPSWVETGSAPMGGGLGETLMFETAHPEAVTIPRKFPDAKRIRVIGGLDPAPFNGIARGLGLAVQRGDLTVDQAVDFLADLLDGRPGSVRGWRHAARGMVDQIRRGQARWGETLGFLALSAVGRTAPYRGGLLVRVTGLRDGVPVAETRRTVGAGPGSVLMADMAAITGGACAAFMVLALEGGAERSGALAPEDWVDPPRFYDALRRIGVPADDTVERVH